jgi:large subunit ribosomal protein L21
MYAVIETGSKQYKVNQGDTIDVELLGIEPEGKVSFDKVLLISGDDKVEIGTPYLTKAKVSGKVVSIFKDKKVVSFKYKHKTNHHRTKGHRQVLAKVLIEEVSI